MRTPARTGIAASLLLAACSRSSSTASTSSNTESLASASASSAAPPASNSAVAKSTRSFKGTYESSAATFYVPDGGEWTGVRYRGDDAGAGIGSGTIALVVDASTHVVRGDADGALGPMLLRGELQDDGAFSATIARKNSGDGGFTGTLLGTIKGDAVTGTIRVSLANANVVRQASISAKGE